MAINTERWGTDIRLLRNLAIQYSYERGNDLATRKGSSSGAVDLDIISGDENLIQALLLRFLTPMGELAALGHATYGSRLYELIGELNSQRNRNLAKLYVLQSLAAEPRVKEVVSVVVTQSPQERTRVDIEITVRPIDSDTTLNLVFPFFFEEVAP